MRKNWRNASMASQSEAGSDARKADSADSQLPMNDMPDECDACHVQKIPT
jgi:hypothetical protein